jgi:hypothetical protein
MDRSTRNPRIELARATAVLQIKLLVDGLRDAILIPVSLVAALIGMFRGGPDCDLEFRRVIKLGRRSERWINLFGHQPPLGGNPVTGSMDTILDQVETAVMEQYKRGTRSPDRAEDQEKEQKSRGA